MCDRKLGCFFFLRLRTLQYEWINMLLRTLLIWFLVNTDALRLSLHLADSVAREFQKTKHILIVLFYLLVASLRFSLMYPCVQFVLSAAALPLLVRWIRRSIALWPEDVYISSLPFFCENCPEHWPVFRSSENKDLFSITFTGSYTSENNCSGQWRRESMGIHAYVLDITSLKQKTVGGL